MTTDQVSPLFHAIIPYQELLGNYDLPASMSG